MSSEFQRTNGDRLAFGEGGPFLGLEQRLSEAGELALAMRSALLRGDADGIDGATARLETIMVEVRLLTDELNRLSPEEIRDCQEHWTESYEALAGTAMRLARESAVNGGVLDGLVRLSQRMLDAVAAGDGHGYDAAGQSARPRLQGLQLKETI